MDIKSLIFLAASFSCIRSGFTQGGYEVQFQKFQIARVHIYPRNVPISGVTNSVKSYVKNSVVAYDGMYSQNSQSKQAKGILFAPRKNFDGCSWKNIRAPAFSWIGVVKRTRKCSLSDQVSAALNASATALIIIHQNPLNHQTKYGGSIPKYYTILTVMMGPEGSLEEWASNGSQPIADIVEDSKNGSNMPINKNSILFVSISFIALTVISLIWLVFYYIQRFRFIHHTDQFQDQLREATAKALNLMPVKILHKEDIEMSCDHDSCSICLELFKVRDPVRVLPCQHQFHSVCVDQWLREKQSCPNCKLNILKAFGLEIKARELRTVTLAQLDLAEASLTPMPNTAHSNTVVISADVFARSTPTTPSNQYSVTLQEVQSEQLRQDSV